MKDSEIFAQITWTRQDIRQLLDENDLDGTEEAVDRLLERLDFLRFDESRLEDGWKEYFRFSLSRTASAFFKRNISFHTTGIWSIINKISYLIDFV